MLNIDIPGHRTLRLEHLLSDYNGTLACDGLLLPGIAPLLDHVAVHLQVRVTTADTVGRVQEQLRGSPAQEVVLPPGNEDEAKLA